MKIADNATTTAQTFFSGRNAMHTIIFFRNFALNIVLCKPCEKFGTEYGLSLQTNMPLRCLRLWFISFFFDDNSLISRAKSRTEIANLEKEIKFYRQNIESDKAKIDALNSSLENLEKFAREEYLMKNENEEIFIIDE